MSDYGPFQITIYDCPEEQRVAVLEVLEAETLGLDFGLAGINDDDLLAIGEEYGSSDSHLDAYETISKALIEKAPGATFLCWNDPKYEYDGMGVAYAPDLGQFTFTCGPAGTPLFSAQQIQSMDASRGKKRDMQLGAPWLARIVDLRLALDAASAQAGNEL